MSLTTPNPEVYNYYELQGLGLKNMNSLTTKEEKQENLNYEINTFRATCKVFFSGIRYGRFWHNILIEAFALHTRVLIDFFYCDQKLKGDDIIAQDLLPDDKVWKDLRPPIPDILKEAKEKVNKQLAHLSEGRILLEKQGKKDWKILEIFNEMNKIIDLFIETQKIKF